MRSLAEIKKIISFCRKNGILRFKDDEFEIELSNVIPKSPRKDSAKEDETPSSSFPSWESLTPEQRLLWSATPEVNGA